MGATVAVEGFTVDAVLIVGVVTETGVVAGADVVGAVSIVVNGSYVVGFPDGRHKMLGRGYYQSTGYSYYMLKRLFSVDSQ